MNMNQNYNNNNQHQQQHQHQHQQQQQNSNKYKTLTEANAMPCRFYGSELGCRFGDMCHYSHDSPNSVPMCKNHGTGPGCFYGDKCHFRHTDFSSTSNIPNKQIMGMKVVTNLDENVNIEICKFFNTKEGCMRDVSCKYRHIKQPKKETDTSDGEDEANGGSRDIE